MQHQRHRVGMGPDDQTAVFRNVDVVRSTWQLDAPHRGQLAIDRISSEYSYGSSISFGDVDEPAICRSINATARLDVIGDDVHIIAAAMQQICRFTVALRPGVERYVEFAGADRDEIIGVSQERVFDGFDMGDMAWLDLTKGLDRLFAILTVFGVVHDENVTLTVCVDEQTQAVVMQAVG